MPPTKGAERGIPKIFRNIAKPNRPKIMEGTAAKLLMLTSIKCVQRLRGANSSRYIAAATPRGKESANVTRRVRAEPTTAPQMPACSASLLAPWVKKETFICLFIMPSFFKCSSQTMD